MKAIKAISTVILALLLMWSCKYDSGADSTISPTTGGVLIQFTNSTNFELENLTVEGRPIGSLEINKTTDYIRFKEVHFEGQSNPVITIRAEVNGEKTKVPFICLTPNHQVVYEGIFELDIYSHVLPRNSRRYLMYELK